MNTVIVKKKSNIFLIYYFIDFITPDTLGNLWDPFYKIINIPLNKSITKELRKLNILNFEQVKILTTTNIPLIKVLITKMVSERLHNGDHNDFALLVSWMETHWTLKFVLLYWKKTCKIRTLVYKCFTI